MSEENPTDKFLAKLAEGVYDDGLKPSVSNLGETIGLLFKAIAFYPKFWGKVLDIKYEDKVAKFETEYKARANKIKPENVQIPHPRIAGPLAQSLEYSIFDDEVRKMFANLLASASDTSILTHPAFVEIINQLSPDEAKILELLSRKPHDVVVHVRYHVNPGESAYTYLHKNISTLPNRAGCVVPEKGSLYLTNLHRLGLVDIPVNWWYSDQSFYSELFSWFEEWKKQYKGGEVSLERSSIRLTSLGLDFVRACISEN